MDCGLPDSSVHGIFQARILEWVAVSSSRRSSPPRDQTRVPVPPALPVDSLLLRPWGSPPNLRHMVRRRRASQEKSMEFKSAEVRVIK